jgi:hypothetical protein
MATRNNSGRDLSRGFDENLEHPARGGAYHGVVDVDTHLVTIQGYTRWTVFAYGAKLFKARSVDDPELRRLEGLFQSLEFNDTRGVDYNDSSDAEAHREN